MVRSIRESIWGLLSTRPRGYTEIADRLGVTAQSLMYFRKNKNKDSSRAASKIAYRLAANFDIDFVEFLLDDRNYDDEGVFLREEIARGGAR